MTASLHFSSWRCRVRSGGLIIAVNLGLLLAILLGLEACLRLAHWQDTGSPYPAGGTVQHVTTEYTTSYHYNDRGFRNDFDFAPLERATPGAFTVAAIGDSFTEGFGVTAAEAWPAQLTQLIGRTHPGTRVLNLGVSGSGPNEYERVFRYALACHPQAVVIGFYVGNDAAEARPYEPPSRFFAINFLAEKIRVMKRLINPNPFGPSLLSRVYRWHICRGAGITVEEFWRRHARLGPEIRRLLANDQINFHLVQQALLDPETISRSFSLGGPTADHGVRAAFALFDAMRQACAQRGILFHVAAIPASVQVSPRYHAFLAGMGFTGLETTLGGSALQRRAIQLAAASSIDYADFIGPLSDEGRDQYYFPIDSHFTAAGHRRLAEAITARFFPAPAPAP